MSARLLRRADGRLDALLTANLRGDIAAQAVTLVLAATLVRSAWMLALVGVRTVTVAGIVVARRLLRRLPPNRGPVLAVLVTGHWLGALGTTAVLPEIAPTTVLLVAGDLLLVAAFLERRSMVAYVSASVATAAAVAALSLQRATGLADRAPGWVVLVTVVGHTVATTGFVGWSAWENDRVLRRHDEQLRGARRRSALAADGERRALEESLMSGTGADLALLGVDLASIGAALATDPNVAATGAAAAAARAQTALRSLREMSHGIFPEALASSGLRPALGAVLDGVPGPLTVDLVEGRHDPDLERAVHVLVTHRAAEAARRGGGLHVRTRTVGDLFVAEAIVAGPKPAAASPLPTALVDRVDALGGEVSDDAGLLWVPTTPDQLEAGPGPAADDRSAAILRRYLRASMWFAGVGLVAVLGVTIATGVSGLLAVAGVLTAVWSALAAARRAAGRGRPDVAVWFVFGEASLAALGVTVLLPSLAAATALISLLPVVLGLPFLPPRQLRAMLAFECAVTGVVAYASLRGDGGLAAALPAAVLHVAVPVAAAALAALVATTVIDVRTEARARGQALQASLRRIVAQADAARRQVERDVHDGAQQQLVAASLQLRVLARQAATEPVAAAATLATVRTIVDAARRDLVVLSRGVYPRALAEGDLVAALASSVSHGIRPVEVAAAGLPLLAPEVAAAGYFCCLEAVQNATKHAGDAARIVIRLGTSAGHLDFEVADDGVGFDPAAPIQAPGQARGLRHLVDRAEALGGRCSIESAPGRGTVVRGRLPLVEGRVRRDALRGARPDPGA